MKDAIMSTPKPESTTVTELNVNARAGKLRAVYYQRLEEALEELKDLENTINRRIGRLERTLYRIWELEVYLRGS
jgi:hypothetical protein